MPVDMNQTIQEASLDNLHDIILPDAVGLFPVAPGWILVGISLLTLLFHFAVKGYDHYKKTLYKREALRELERSKYDSKEGLVALLTLARRVAIAAYGREATAKLTGDAWWNFMEQHSKVQMSGELREKIATLLYDSSSTEDTSSYQTMRSIVEVWIKTHKVSDNV